MPLATLQLAMAQSLYQPGTRTSESQGPWGRVPAVLAGGLVGELEELRGAFREELLTRITEAEGLPAEEQDDLLEDLWREEELAKSIEEEFERLLLQAACETEP